MSATPETDELEYAEQSADCPVEHQLISMTHNARKLEGELAVAIAERVDAWTKIDALHAKMAAMVKWREDQERRCRAEYDSWVAAPF